MKGYNRKKLEQLGLHIGTATHRLRKMIIFNLLKKLGENFCHQCSAEIETIEELSIEHKTPWLDSENPNDLFFDINNISFSHLSCNIKAKRPKKFKHPSELAYRKGCRCNECTEINAMKQRKRRAK